MRTLFASVWRAENVLLCWDPDLLCGVEDIDNTSLDDRPKMFDGVARPYVIAYEEVFSKLGSCGVGGPTAQTAEAEKSLRVIPIS